MRYAACKRSQLSNFAFAAFDLSKNLRFVMFSIVPFVVQSFALRNRGLLERFPAQRWPCHLDKSILNHNHLSRHLSRSFQEILCVDMMVRNRLFQGFFQRVFQKMYSRAYLLMPDLPIIYFHRSRSINTDCSILVQWAKTQLTYL